MINSLLLSGAIGSCDTPEVASLPKKFINLVIKCARKGNVEHLRKNSSPLPTSTQNVALTVSRACSSCSLGGTDKAV
jgi:hypothetical protein